MNISSDILVTIPIMMVPFLLSLSIHETAHAWVANRLGDPTAKLMGRVSLNPMVHMDPIGTILFPVIGALSGFMFGWAKPVPVNPINLRNYREQIFWISLAGPLSNFILSFLFTFFWVVLIKFRGVLPMEIYSPISHMLNYGIIINLALCFFNLIPLGPLDGAKILNRFLPLKIAMALENFSMHSMIILLFLMFFGILGGIISPPMIYFSNLFKNIAFMILF